jgi:beta-aspartyl-peptidase (threonine type)
MKKGSSLDGAESAVKYMEQSGLFNAGRGACLTVFGRVELDAAVIYGKGPRGAGVGACTCTYNPVSLARFVMENTEHVLIAGDYCRSLARAAGMKVDTLKATEAVAKRYSELKGRLGELHPKNLELIKRTQEGNTVGAVALDSEGTPSAAVSTGGLWMKLPGRIGDSAIIGAGVYADQKSGAACATGSGEEIIRNAMSWNACSFLRRDDALTAARKAVSLVSRRSGRNTAGIITLDLKGRVGFSYNTEAMGRAWLDPIKDKIVVAI